MIDQNPTGEHDEPPHTMTERIRGLIRGILDRGSRSSQPPTRPHQATLAAKATGPAVAASEAVSLASGSSISEAGVQKGRCPGRPPMTAAAGSVSQPASTGAWAGRCEVT